MVEAKASYKSAGDGLQQAKEYAQIHTYSLRQGIDDGFLAPYRVHRIITTYDALGWRPSQGELDRYGKEIPDEEYQTKDFERAVALLARTKAIAKSITDFLKKTNRFDKTIVFCVDQEHADELRRQLNNLNADLVRQNPNYVCRVTSDEGDVGLGHLSKFQDVETDAKSPVILTTSQLLTTGVDAPTCKNIILARVVNSMVEFKQIIGRGTRLRDDYGKYFFNILDFTQSTRLFADPEFDGDPAVITEQAIDDEGNPTGEETEVAQAEAEEDEEGERTTAARQQTPKKAALAKSGRNSTSMAGRSRLPPTWSTSLTPAASNSRSWNTPTTPRRRCGRFSRMRPSCGRNGPILLAATRSSSRWRSGASSSTNWPMPPGSRTPIRLTCFATWPSMLPCGPAGNGPTA